MGVHDATATLAFGVIFSHDDYHKKELLDDENYKIEIFEFKDHYTAELEDKYPFVCVDWIPEHGILFYADGTRTRAWVEGTNQTKVIPIKCAPKQEWENPGWPSLAISVPDGDAEEFICLAKKLYQNLNFGECPDPQWLLIGHIGDLG